MVPILRARRAGIACERLIAGAPSIEKYGRVLESGLAFRRFQALERVDRSRIGRVVFPRGSMRNLECQVRDSSAAEDPRRRRMSILTMGIMTTVSTR